MVLGGQRVKPAYTPEFKSFCCNTAIPRGALRIGLHFPAFPVKCLLIFTFTWLSENSMRRLLPSLFFSSSLQTGIYNHLGSQITGKTMCLCQPLNIRKGRRRPLEETTYNCKTWLFGYNSSHWKGLCQPHAEAWCHAGLCSSLPGCRSCPSGPLEFPHHNTPWACRQLFCLFKTTWPIWPELAAGQLFAVLFSS